MDIMMIDDECVCVNDLERGYMRHNKSVIPVADFSTIRD